MALTVTDFTFRQPLLGPSPSEAHENRWLLITEANVDVSFWDNVANGGGSIRVSEDAEGLNQLPVDVHVCDTVTQKLVMYIKMPVYSSALRLIHVFAADNASTQPLATDTYGYNAVWANCRCAFFADMGGEDRSGKTGTILGPSFPDNIGSLIGNGDNARTFTIKPRLDAWTNYDESGHKDVVNYSPSGNEIILRYNGYSSFRSFESRVKGGFGSVNSIKSTVVYTNDSQFDEETLLQWSFKPSGGQAVKVTRGATTESVISSSSTTSNFNNSATLPVGSSGFDYELFIQRNTQVTEEYIEVEKSNLMQNTAFWTQGTVDNPSGGVSLPDRLCDIRDYLSTLLTSSISLESSILGLDTSYSGVTALHTILLNTQNSDKSYNKETISGDLLAVVDTTYKDSSTQSENKLVNISNNISVMEDDLQLSSNFSLISLSISSVDIANQLVDSTVEISLDSFSNDFIYDKEFKLVNLTSVVDVDLTDTSLQSEELSVEITNNVVSDLSNQDLQLNLSNSYVTSISEVSDVSISYQSDDLEVYLVTVSDTSSEDIEFQIDNATKLSEITSNSNDKSNQLSLSVMSIGTSISLNDIEYSTGNSLLFYNLVEGIGVGSLNFSNLTKIDIGISPITKSNIIFK